MIKCKLCGKKYTFKHGSGTKKYCAKCYYLIYRLKVKIKCIDIKGGKCGKCGYDKSLRALSFHHINERDKSFDISDNLCKKWKDILEELDKCILLCENCHVEIHSDETEEKYDL